MRIEKFIDEMDIQATRLWQGRGIDVEELNRQIVTFVSIMKQKVQKFFTLGIDFPTEYAEVALEHLKQAMSDRDDYKLADCLYYEWRDIAIVLQEVIDEVE